MIRQVEIHSSVTAPRVVSKKYLDLAEMGVLRGSTRKYQRHCDLVPQTPSLSFLQWSDDAVEVLVEREVRLGRNEIKAGPTCFQVLMRKGECGVCGGEDSVRENQSPVERAQEHSDRVMQHALGPGDSSSVQRLELCDLEPAWSPRRLVHPPSNNVRPNSTNRARLDLPKFRQARDMATVHKLARGFDHSRLVILYPVHVLSNFKGIISLSGRSASP